MVATRPWNNKKQQRPPFIDSWKIQLNRKAHSKINQTSTEEWITCLVKNKKLQRPIYFQNHNKNNYRRLNFASETQGQARKKVAWWKRTPPISKEATLQNKVCCFRSLCSVTYWFFPKGLRIEMPLNQEPQNRGQVFQNAKPERKESLW